LRGSETIRYVRIVLLRCGILICVSGFVMSVPEPPPDFLNHGRPMLDAHNCYPDDGQWGDRIDRALSAGFPLSIEQDLAWYQDPATHTGRVVVSHSARTSGSEPTLREYFFEHVRPIVTHALSENKKASWPLIVLHFDFKDNQEPLLRAVWELLGEYEPWLTTAAKTADVHELAAFDVKPILAITEDSDAQQQVFFDQVPVGGRLRVFGSAHTNIPRTKDRRELEHLAATVAPDQLLAEAPTDYRRWWNNSWHEVEEGGQTRAGAWTDAKSARLRALVNRAHQLGYWIRFYTLDGFNPDSNHGWSAGYNFGSPAAARLRWQAAVETGVDMIATDQYEDLAAFLRQRATP